MRHRSTVFAALLLFLTLAWAAGAAAGWFSGLGRDKEARRPGVHRYGGTRSGMLYVGMLAGGSGGSWQLDGQDVVVGRDCRIEVAGTRRAEPVGASRALVLGTSSGGVIVARQIRVLAPVPADPAADGIAERWGVVPSDANPDLGVGTEVGIE
jgi:hypothetical protein